MSEVKRKIARSVSKEVKKNEVHPSLEDVLNANDPGEKKMEEITDVAAAGSTTAKPSPFKFIHFCCEPREVVENKRYILKMNTATIFGHALWSERQPCVRDTVVFIKTGILFEGILKDREFIIRGLPALAINSGVLVDSTPICIDKELTIVLHSIETNYIINKGQDIAEIILL